MLFRKSATPPTVVWRPGSVDLHDRQIFTDPGCELVRQFLARVFSLAEVTSVEIDHRLATAVVRFDRHQPASEILTQLTAALRRPEPVGNKLCDVLKVASSRRRTTNVFRLDGSYVLIPTVSGIKRITYLALAGGSFGMSIVGVVVPGIPTVPFVLLTSYFLVRSSPILNERLLRSRLFGPLLRDWQLHGAVRARVKWISIGVTILILMASVFLIGISGPLLIVALGMATFGIYLILRLPTLHEPQPDAWPVPAIAISAAT